MPIPLGVLAVAGAGAAGGGSAFDLLETTLISTTTASVTFSNLGSYSDYKHLQIRAVARTNEVSSTESSYAIRLNGNTGTSYNGHLLYGTGSSVASGSNGAGTRMFFSGAAGNDATANAFGAMVLDILDFSSSSKNTTLRALSGISGGATRIYLNSGLFNNTAAVTSIEIALQSGSFVSGTRLSLYGIK